MQKILFIDNWPGVEALSICGNGLGGSLFKLAALADAAQQGFVVDLLTSSLKAELLEDAGGITCLYTSEDDIEFDSYQQLIMLGIVADGIEIPVNCRPFTDVDKKQYKKEAHIVFWRRYVAALLNYPLPQTPALMQVKVNSAVLRQTENRLSRSYRWVALSRQVISDLKDYALWDDVVDELLEREDVAIVLLGDRPMAYREHDRVLNLMGRTSIDQLKALALYCDVVVGVDGLLTNLGMLLATPVVALFSMIDPVMVVDENQVLRSAVNVLVTKGCPLQYCYPQIHNYRNAGCLYNKQGGDEGGKIDCLQFKATDVSASILAFFSQKPTS